MPYGFGTPYTERNFQLRVLFLSKKHLPKYNFSKKILECVEIFFYLVIEFIQHIRKI